MKNLLPSSPTLAAATPDHADGAAATHAMDQFVPQSRRKFYLVLLTLIVFLLLAAWQLRQWQPQGLQVALTDLQVASVQRGMFLDNLQVRASAVARDSMMLDAVESGRVEQVLQTDGALVKQGEVLFHLSNSQRQLELLARQAEYAQQITNLSNLRASYEASKSEMQRRLTEQQYSVAQAHSQLQRDAALFERAFIAEQVLTQARDKLALQQQLLHDLQRSSAAELAIKQAAVRQMEAALQNLQSGMALANANLQALAVRAPRSGRLTDFHVQLGQFVKAEQHLGRIDDANAFKLTAQVDEFYLNRIAPGHAVQVQLKEQYFKARLSRVLPQIKDGRFMVEMEFLAQQPALSAGRSLDVVINLGEPAPALLLPNGSFINESGGNWLFVLAADKKTATRRNVKIGRRNPGQIEILSGLQAGEQVIISSYASFGKEQQLQLQ